MATKTATAPTGVRTAKAGAARGKAPSKTSINFADLGVKHSRWWLAIPAIIVILLVAAAIAKFAVIDRLDEVNVARSEASVVQSQLDLCKARIESYGELNEQYAHYTYSGMTAEEMDRVDRVTIMDLIERTLSRSVEVPSWFIKGNVLTLNVEGKNLKRINDTVQKLQDDPLVDYCVVNAAQTGVNARSENKDEMVTANIFVYLKNPEEVD